MPSDTISRDIEAEKPHSLDASKFESALEPPAGVQAQTEEVPDGGMQAWLTVLGGYFSQCIKRDSFLMESF